MVACALALQLAASSVGSPPPLPPLRLGQLTAAELAAPPPSAGRQLGAFVLSGALAAAADAAVVGLFFAMVDHASADTLIATAPLFLSVLVGAPPIAAGLVTTGVLGPDRLGRSYTAALIAHGLAMLLSLALIADRGLDPGPGLAVFCAIDFALTGGAAVLFHRPSSDTVEWRPAQASAPATHALPPPRRG